MRKAKAHRPAPFPRKVVDYPRLRVEFEAVKSYVGIKRVVFQARVVSESQDKANRRDEKGRPTLQGGRYFVQVAFEGVEFTTEKKRGFHEGEIVDGEQTYFRSPSLSRNKMKMKCTCEDYRFVAEYANAKDKLNLGGWRRYQRKTPAPADKFEQNRTLVNGKVSYPHKNPADVVAMCKHLYNFTRVLREKDMVKL